MSNSQNTSGQRCQWAPQFGRVRGHTVCFSCLPTDPIIVDGGAHRGEFSREIFERTGRGRFLLIEANPDLAGACQPPPNGIVLSAGLGPTDGYAGFKRNVNPEAGSLSTVDNCSLSEKIRCVSLPTLMKVNNLDRVDLLKLDIEGQEFALLRAVEPHILQEVGQITVEFHDFLPEFSDASAYASARKRLVDLGYVCCPMSFRMHSDILFLNRRHLYVPVWKIRLSAIAWRFILKAREMHRFRNQKVQ